MFKPRSEKPAVTLKSRLRAARRRALVHLSIAALSLAAGFYFLHSSQIGLLERQAFALKSDLFSVWHQKEFAAARRRILLLPISESTFEELRIKQKDSTMPRRYHAKVIRELKRLGARAIVFDMAFVEPKADDAALIAAAQEFRRIVWATYWQGSEANGVGQDGMIYPLPALRKIGLCGHPRMPNASDSFEDEARPSTDKIEAVFFSESESLPALCIQAARLAGKDLSLKIKEQHLQAGSYSVPLDEERAFKIIFSAPPGQGFVPVPYEYLLNAVPKEISLSDGALFKDRIVFIGDTTELGKDFGFTPNGRMSGVEIHAHALANVLHGNIVRDAPASFNFYAVTAAILLFAITSLLVPLRFYAPCLLLLGVSVVCFNFWIFLEQSLDLALVAPLSAGFLMALAVLAERGWTTEGESRRLSGLLKQYVSPQLAQSGAPHGEVTLVFTDIEGSSLLSERFGAPFEKARAAHFELLRDAARRWNGFEVETAGDSLFVVFADAADAVRFAVAGQLALKKHHWPTFLRKARVEQNSWSGFDLPVRMGLHTGRPFIRQDRNRLTYRGPDTNRAARVMSAGQGGQILLSQTTRDKVGEILQADAEFHAVKFEELGARRLKNIGEVVLWQACHPELSEMNQMSLNT